MKLRLELDEDLRQERRGGDLTEERRVAAQNAVALEAAHAVLDGAAAGDPQVAQRFDPAVALFRRAGAGTGQCGPGGGHGVDRIGLALPAAGLTVWPVDLDHLHAHRAAEAALHALVAHAAARGLHRLAQREARAPRRREEPRRDAGGHQDEDGEDEERAKDPAPHGQKATVTEKARRNLRGSWA